MMNMRIISLAAATAALAFVGACGSDSSTPTTPTSPQGTLDLSAAIAQTTSGDVSSFAGARSAIGVPGVTSPTFDPSQCPYTASDQSFTCPSRTQSGITFTLKYFLYDAGGAALSQVNPLTTAAVRTVLDAKGTLQASAEGSIALNHHSDMKLSGLLSATRTLNGTARDRDTVAVTSNGGTVRTAIDATSTTTNLVLPSTTSNPYPASGTIATDVAGSSTLGNNFSTATTVHTVLTFNGTNIATLTISAGAGASMTCQVDLSGKTAPRC